MSEMVERVAKAIGRALSGFENQDAVQDCGPILEKGRPFWKHYEKAAEDAIAAMREPTIAMNHAGSDTYGLTSPVTGWLPLSVIDGQPKKTWKAMIDEALK